MALGQTVTVAPVVLAADRVEAAAARRNFSQSLRLLQAGTGYDRTVVREALLRDATALDDLLCAAVSGGNHFVQRQVCLVLMETGPRKAPPTLLALARGDLRGARAYAALALGKFDDASVWSALVAATESALPEERRMAIIAMGRSVCSEAAEFLMARVGKGQELERISTLLALACGVSGPQQPGGASLSELEPALRKELLAREDRVRRAALSAIGEHRGASAAAARLHALNDEDAQCRRVALEGLALDSVDLLSAQRLMKLWQTRATRSGEEVARVVMALNATHSGAELEAVLTEARGHRDARVRQAAAAAALYDGARQEQARALLADESAQVRLTALLALALRGAADASWLLHAQDPDENVRAAAVHCAVWKGGLTARAALGALDSSPHADVRRLAASCALLLESDAPRAVALARARAQVLLDDSGGSATWTLRRSLHEQIYEVLDLNNALSRGGGGAAPGGGSAAARALGAAASKASSGDEDLRRHLDLHPYADRRFAPELLR